MSIFVSRPRSVFANFWLIRVSPATRSRKFSTTAVMALIPPNRSYSEPMFASLLLSTVLPLVVLGVVFHVVKSEHFLEKLDQAHLSQPGAAEVRLPYRSVQAVACAGVHLQRAPILLVGVEEGLATHRGAQGAVGRSDRQPCG